MVQSLISSRLTPFPGAAGLCLLVARDGDFSSLLTVAPRAPPPLYTQYSIGFLVRVTIEIVPIIPHPGDQVNMLFFFPFAMEVSPPCKDFLVTIRRDLLLEFCPPPHYSLHAGRLPSQIARFSSPPFYLLFRSVPP